MCSELAELVLEEREIALPNLSLCWVMGKSASMRCWTFSEQCLLLTSITLWCSGSSGWMSTQATSKSLYDTTFPAVLDTVLQWLFDPQPIPRLISLYLYYPITHSS